MINTMRKWGCVIWITGFLGIAVVIAPSILNAAELEWAGYLTADYENETKDGSNASFDAFALSLIPTVNLAPNLDIYAQFVFEHGGFFEFNAKCGTPPNDTCPRVNNPRNTGELVLIDSYITYGVDQWLKIRGGKFATPFGFWNTHQYAGPTYVTIRQPGRETVYSRGDISSENAKFFGRFSMGVWLLGEWKKISYDLYVVNGRTLLDDHKDDNENKGIGGRLEGEVPLGPSKLVLLYSIYRDSLRAKTTEPFVDQISHAISLKWSLGGLAVTSEYALSERDETKMNAYYLLAQYTFLKRWTPFVQYQALEPDKDKDDDKTTYSSIGVVYHIVPWAITLKLQADRVNLEDSSKDDFSKNWAGISALF